MWTIIHTSISFEHFKVIHRGAWANLGLFATNEYPEHPNGGRVDSTTPKHS
jgi:hypothetical protein